jgi:hypothetical protein
MVDIGVWESEYEEKPSSKLIDNVAKERKSNQESRHMSMHISDWKKTKKAVIIPNFSWKFVLVQTKMIRTCMWKCLWKCKQPVNVTRGQPFSPPHMSLCILIRHWIRPACNFQYVAKSINWKLMVIESLLYFTLRRKHTSPSDTLPRTSKRGSFNTKLSNFLANLQCCVKQTLKFSTNVTEYTDVILFCKCISSYLCHYEFRLLAFSSVNISWWVWLCTNAHCVSTCMAVHREDRLSTLGVSAMVVNGISLCWHRSGLASLCCRDLQPWVHE